MRHAGENASLGCRGVALQALDAADGNFLLVKFFQQKAAGLIIANNPNRQNADAERSQVHHCIGAAAGHHGSLATLQDQHWRLAGDASDFAKDKFVGHQIGQHGDRDLRKLPDNLLPAFRVFGELVHEVK